MSTTPAKGGRGQTAIGCLVAILVIAIPGYFQFVRVANEFGPVGMDVDGRRIFLQSLSAGAVSGAGVTSEWEDSNVVARLLIQEPMRTTIRIRLPANAGTTSSEQMTALSAPFTPFDDNGEQLYLTAKATIGVPELNKRLSDLSVRTFGDLLAACGFRRYEVYQGSDLLFASDLPKVGEGNTKFAGWTR